MSIIDDIRDEKGQLPVYAWPGGYPLFYITADGLIICPWCANDGVETSDPVVNYDINYEDPDLWCDDAGGRIESAYAEDDVIETPELAREAYNERVRNRVTA